MKINATLINLYNVCKRELWLHANGVRFEHTSDLVLEGKLIHEESYPLRSEKYEEIEIDGIKVDYYDTKNKVIHEIKKSNKVEKAHEWQLKYYMYVFEQHGVDGVTGILEYPTLRKTQQIVLSDVDRDMIKEMLADIDKVITSDDCPPIIKKGICKNCSYYEFCFTKEIEE
jgi:CRISPR-associated exonuclease Cas4